MAEKLFAPISLGDAALSKAPTAPMAKWRLCSAPLDLALAGLLLGLLGR
jgi:hypothetical protein